jgi:hypothetical protein
LGLLHSSLFLYVNEEKGAWTNRNMSRGIMKRFGKWMKQRDPGERQYRMEWMSVERFKRTAAATGAVMLLGINLSITQILDPSSVKPCKMDGRSLVT